MNIPKAALAAALLVCLAACQSSSSPTSPGAAHRLTVSGHPEWPPVMFRSGAAIDGAGPALVRKIFADLKISAAFEYQGAWDEVQAKARTGAVDVLVAAYKTTERQGYMLYSEPYTTDPIALFVAKGKAFPFGSWDVLIGRKGVAMVGDSYGQQFDDFAAAKLQLTRAGTVAQAFDLIASGQADYFLYSLYAGDDELKKTGAAGRFESLPTYVSEEPFYLTISRKSPLVTYLPLINQQLEKYMADGTVKALIAHYRK
jgi:polar amino acid transport system substrate-binding protein